MPPTPCVARAPSAPRTQPRLTLATDLDGTLLGGTRAERARLFELLRDRTDTRLIFVTGRGLETVLPLLADPLVPRPDIIIADVGATVVDAATLEAIQPLQSEISARWPGILDVLEVLVPFEGLIRQDVPQERRCSFTFDCASASLPEIEAAVRRIGCELLVSAGRYVDVLPAGVSKGSTLRTLLRELGTDPSSVVVAGDTMNDASMFEGELRGIVVGNAEPALVHSARTHERSFLAPRAGAGGILDGLVAHGFLDPEVERAASAAGDAQLVMVYHRLPFDEYRRAGKTLRRRPKSPNGIIPSLLGFFAQGRSGSWVAWSIQQSRAPDELEEVVEVDAERYPNLTAARVPLTKADVGRFYKEFSKEALWPIIFSFPGKAHFRQEQWQHFLEINELFADRTAREARRGATVWIHDYNLWMVPAFLRRSRPDVKIAFFHHTAFPPPDVFNIVPWRREIVGSLLQCDYVGFHIPRYAENFVEVVRSAGPARVVSRASCAPRFVTYGCALGVDDMATEIEVERRRIRIGAHPVGIDVGLIRRILDRPESRERIAQISEELAGRRAIISVERLDYVKGPLEKIEAYERLLEDHPELHGEVAFVNIVPPPAPGMQIYRTIGAKLDQAVGRVNGRFGRIDWTPVRYFLRALPFEEVVAHYAVADVAWISPLRDGLNLVAKEYVAAQDAVGRSGALLLSEFAGAAVELHGAILTNPFDKWTMAEDLHRAVTMGDDEREQRMRRLAAIVRHNDVDHWGEEFLAAVEGP